VTLVVSPSILDVFGLTALASWPDIGSASDKFCRLAQPELKELN
jgi:hypothetical protein